MTRKEIEKAVQRIVDERVKNSKRDLFCLRFGEDDFADFNLESPLASDLLSKTKVVRRKTHGADWSVCLAVMTADSYFHLFEIKSPNVTMATTPEVAFTMLAPRLIIPNGDNQMLGKTNFGKGWGDPLTPTESLILSKCKAKRLNDVSFEMTESITTTGASKFMSKSSRRKIMIETQTKEDTDDWIQILTA
mmetsp:Transcript_11570/g.20409  ORF Transcript_11570/g.20409 Transcript_11570/m.20409 type:complete len:191 (+) Transcript_11570:639-1211(+)